MGGPLGSDTCATNRVCRITYRGPMGPSAESLELPDGPWWQVAHTLGPTPIVLPSGLELVRLLERLGVDPDDAVELPGVLAEVLTDPRLSWLATRYATTLVRDLGALGLPTI